MTRGLALLFLATIAVASSAAPADAAPIAGLFSAIVAGTAKLWAVVGSTLLGRAALQIVTGLAASAISRLFRKDPPPRGVMRRVDFGGDRPMRVLLGEYATAGHLVWSGSHGSDGKTPNAYFTDVVLLSVLPIDGITGVQVNSVRVDLGAEAHPDYGLPVLDFRTEGSDYLWIKVYDGTQTDADPMLLAKYGTGAGTSEDYPWSADMVGDGLAYAIITTRGNNDLFGGQVPSVLFETRGAKLYDRRLDSTAGGDGPQRLDDRSTWAFSANPQVALSTILTAGLAWGDQHLYGPRWPAHVFDAANLFAALNACDVETPGNDGEAEAMYRFGADLDLSTEPRTFLRELLKCSAADLAICEGKAFLHVGPASAPVALITDAQCSVSHAQDLDPFRGLEELFNTASATFPDPVQAWAMVPAPGERHLDWEAEDGGKRTAAMPFPFVPWVSQVQRLVASSLRDQRRQRVHRIVLGWAFGHLAPLDYIAWTSARNGYTAKIFKVVSVHDHPTGHVEIALLEEDPDDFTPPALIEHQPTPPARPVVLTQSVPGFAVSPYVLEVEGAPRRAGILAQWDPEGADDARGLRIAVRRAGDTGAGSEQPLHQVTAGAAVIVEGLVAGDYEVRARFRVERPTSWTAWLPVTVADVRLGLIELTSEIVGWLGHLQEWIDGGVSDLPAELLGLAEAQAAEAQARIDGLLAASEALAAEAQARADGLAAGSAALASEVQARVDGLAAASAALGEEATARAAAVAEVAASLTAETADRVALAQATAETLRDQRARLRAVAGEVVELASQAHLAREELRQRISAEVGEIRATYDAQIIVLADADAALAAQITSLQVTAGDLAASITQVDQARIDGDAALASLITAVSVGTATQFDQAQVWYWDSAPEGWTGDPVAPAVTAPGWLRPGAASSALSPAGLAIAGGTYQQVRARLRRVGSPVWLGHLWWAGAAEGWDTGRRVTLAEPAFDDDIALITWAPEWTGAIDRLRVELADGSDAANYYELDWLAVGRPAPGASSAELLAEQAARIAGDLAEAAARLLLAAQINDVEGLATATADAASALETRTTAAEGAITAQSTRLTALEATVDDPETGVGATAAGLETLTAQVQALDDGSQVLLAEAIRNLRTALRRVALEASDAGAHTALQTQAVRDYVAEASQVLTTRIEATDSTVAVIAEAVTVLQAAIPGLATADALAALTTSVTDQGTLIEVLSSALTALSASVGDLETGQAGNASAIEAVEARTTAAEGEITAQGTRLSAVEAGVSDLETGQAGNASAIEAVETRTTAAEGQITAQGTRLSAVESGVSDLETGQAGNASAIEAVETRTTAAEGEIAAQGTRLAAVEATVDDPETGVEATAAALETLSSQVQALDDGSQVLLAEALRNLRTALRRVALEASDAGAHTALQTQAVRDYVAEASQVLTTRIEATDSTVAVIAEAVTVLQAAIPGLATADALAALTTSVTDQGTLIEVLSAALTALSASVGDLETGQAGNASAIDALEVRTTATEGEITAQGTRLTAVEAGVSDLETGQAGNASAIEAVETRTTAAEGEIAAQGTRLATVEAGVSDLETGQAGNASAIEAVETRTTTAEGEIAAQGTRLSAVEADVSDLETGQAGNASAIEAVETRTTAAEGEITAQGTRLSAVEAGVSDLETGQAGNASALDALDARTTIAEGQISSQGSRLTAVETDVSDLETGQAGNASAIDALDARTTIAEGQITSQGTRLTSVESSVSDLETGQAGNASAIEAVEARTTTAEGTIASLAEAQTALSAELANKADASTVTSLTTQVAEIDGEVSALAGATTIVQAAVQGANLIANGSVASGTLAGWSAVAPGFTVVARNTASATPAEAAAPTPHVLTIAQNAADQSAEAAVAVPVTAGEILRASLQRAASGASRNVTLTLTAIWLDAAGAAVGTPQTLLTTLATATSWALASGEGVAVPAGAVAVTLRLTRAGGGAGTGWVTRLRVERDGLGLSDITASGLFRMEAAAGPSGYSRLALVGRTSTAEVYREAGLYIDTPVDPGEPSRVAVQADQFAVIGPDGAIVPFIIDGDRIYLTGSAIRLTGDTEVDGTFVVRSGDTGARSELRPDSFRVYNAAGVALIKLGWLG